MPYLIMAIGTFAISALSLTKDLMQETQESSDDISNIALTTTLLIVAGVGAYLVATDKIKFQIK